MMRSFFILASIFSLVSCNSKKPYFKHYIDSLQEIKTPLTFADGKTLETLVGSHDLKLDTLFFGQGYTPVGRIQTTQKTITLLLLESGLKNKIHIKTFDCNGNQLETFLVDTDYGQVNDSVFRGGNWTLKNSNVLIQFDTIQESSHYEGGELMTSRWAKDSIIIYPNSRLKKGNPIH